MSGTRSVNAGAQATAKKAGKGAPGRETWNTKYGPRRVRHDPPTLAEAIDAARGLTDDLEAQVEFAASLMGLPADEVRAEIRKSAPPRKDATIAFTTNRSGSARAVVVERKPSRRLPTRRVVA